MSSAFGQYRMFYERGYIVDNIRSYMISITAAAILCAIVMLLTGKKSKYYVMIKTLCGIFITVTAFSPVIDLKLDMVDFFDAGFLEDGKEITAMAQREVYQELSAGIIAQSETYILSKADFLHADITAQIELNDENPPVPWRVRLAGQISPYGKTVLTEYIEKDLEIPEERQIWTSIP